MGHPWCTPTCEDNVFPPQNRGVQLITEPEVVKQARAPRLRLAQNRLSGYGVEGVGHIHLQDDPMPRGCPTIDHPCAPMATTSVAFRSPTPTCSGYNVSICCFVRPLARSALPTTRLRVSPTPTGRTPPSDFLSGVRFAQQSQGPCDSGRLPRAHASVSSASA